MRDSISVFWGALLFSSSCPVLAQVVDTPINFKQPVIKSAAVARFCRKHHDAKTLCFVATYTECINSIKQRKTLNTYNVQARRPNRYVVWGHPILMEHWGPGNRAIVFYGSGETICTCDGKTELQLDPHLRIYSAAPAPAKVYDSNAPALTAINAFAVLDTDLLTNHVPAPDEQLNGRHMIVFVQNYASKGDAYEQDKMYFAADTGELVRWTRFDVSKNALFEDARVDYSGWQFNTPKPDAHFVVQIPPGYRTLAALGAALKAQKAQQQHAPSTPAEQP